MLVGMDLVALNDAPRDILAASLTSCADVPRWVDALVDDRPYESVDALLSYADSLAATWTDDEVTHALAQHPRIGERSRRPAAEAAMSAHEQSGVRAGGDVAARLREANAAYEEQFDRVFLVRAAGRDADEVLALLEGRLSNDDATEREVVKGQLREIALLRLRDAVTTTTLTTDAAREDGS